MQIFCTAMDLKLPLRSTCVEQIYKDINFHSNLLSVFWFQLSTIWNSDNLIVSGLTC